MRRNGESTPICDTLEILATHVRANFHALPISHARSIVKSRLFQRFVKIFGKELFTREETHTGEGFDSFFGPNRCIRESQQQTAEAFGADASLFVTGGTTCANRSVLVGLRSCRALADRTCHQSIPFALEELFPRARVTYLPARTSSDGSGRTAVNISELLKEYRAALQIGDPYNLVVLNGCSYEGVFLSIERVLSELAAISDNVLVLVDEAWFAFAYFDPDYRPHTAMAAARSVRSRGARIGVIATQSVHKSLSSLRQGSLIHICGDSRLIEQITLGRHQMHTTSPSYPILASIELARAQAVCEGAQMINQSLGLAGFLMDTLSNFQGVRINTTTELLDSYTNLDPLRVSIDVSGLCENAEELRRFLFHRFGIHLSRVTKTAILANIHIGVSPRCVGLLIEALRSFPGRPVADGFVIPYPPGVPVLVPGDAITAEKLREIESLKKSNTIVFDSTKSALFKTQNTNGKDEFK